MTKGVSQARKSMPRGTPEKPNFCSIPFLQLHVKNREAEKNNSGSLVVERTEPKQPVGGTQVEKVGVLSQAESRGTG